MRFGSGFDEMEGFVCWINETARSCSSDMIVDWSRFDFTGEQGTQRELQTTVNESGSGECKYSISITESCRGFVKESYQS